VDLVDAVAGFGQPEVVMRGNAQKGASVFGVVFLLVGILASSLMA
jgi:hypothetical protein